MAEFNFRRLLSSIEEVGQCPICLELVKPPVTLCVNGHGICSACKNSLTKCPTCSKLFCNFQARILNDILQKIPKACKFEDKGCNLPAIEDHELYCKFRTVKCNFLQENNPLHCDFTMTANTLLAHIDMDDPPHSTPHWITIYDITSFKICGFNDVVQAKSIYEHGTKAEENNQIFVFYYAKIKGNFCLYIKHFPLGNPTTISYFILSFENIYPWYMVEYKYKIKATIMSTIEPEVKVDENVYCMRVPVEELEKRVDEDGNLRVYLEVKTESLVKK